MKFIHILLAAILSGTIVSCSTQKTSLPYFVNLSETVTEPVTVGEFAPKVEPDDELLIVVTSVEPAATALYNLPFTNPALRDDVYKSTTPQQQTYIVDSEGNINFPVLGKVHVEGETVEQIQHKLTELISKDVEDPLVTVSLINFRVVIAGEVHSPRSVRVYRSRYSLLDALADAGDLTEYGERSNVLLVREENGERKFIRFDLNSAETLTSPYFFLKQNDYIYVQPNQIRQENSKYNQNNAYKLTVTSTVVSAASVIASLIIALTIK